MNSFRLKSVKLMAVLLTIFLIVPLALNITANDVFADPAAEVESTNPWGDGGQIVLNLSGCSGYGEITVVVDFGGKVTSASGWGFDSYTPDGNKVTAKVSASGSNSWAFNGNVGIQVSGSNIDDISLVSISGSGTSDATRATNATNATTTTSSGSGGSGSDDTTGGTTAEAVQGDDWLTTDGSKIVDSNGTEVWLTGVNWFGYNTGTNLFDGCWSCSMKGALEAIADHGFNLLRVPISAQLLLQWKSGEYPTANYNTSTNADLEGKNSLEILDYAMQICKDNGIKVMFDIHSCETDAMGHMKPLWYTDTISEDQYVEAVSWLTEHYSDDDTVVAIDLKNEPHGAAADADHAIWNDSDDQNNWKRAAERAGNAVLDINPNLLIVIEGIQIYPTDISTNNFTSTNDGDYNNSWWGGNLMGVADYPIDFGDDARNKQIVYSPHDYGPAVYQQPWFHSGFTYDSLKDEYWYDYWLYIDEENIAPILIGEWGGFMEGDNLTWMTDLRQLISDDHLNYTFWCFNANSGDTGGLVLDDFTTWDEDKYSFVSEVLWKDDEGHFIGLDHAVPLGQSGNGVSLSEYSGIAAAPETNTTETTATASNEQEDTTLSEATAEPSTSSSKTTKKVDIKAIVKPIIIGVLALIAAALVFAIGRFTYLKGAGLKTKEALKMIFIFKKNK